MKLLKLLSNLKFRQESLPKKTQITDFFQIDIASIPDNTFKRIEYKNNIFGPNIIVHQKMIDYKECGIFNIVEVQKVMKTSTVIVFRCSQPNLVNQKRIRILINDLYRVYGNDDNNKGKFSAQDMLEYEEEEFNVLFGRHWSFNVRPKSTVMIRRDDEHLELVVECERK